MKRNLKVMKLVTAAMIAALYVVLSLLSNAFGLAFHVIQFRISEALTILPAFTISAVPGLAVGCFLFNLFSGAPMPDVVFGTAATLLGAVGSYFVGCFAKKSSTSKKRKGWTCLIPVPPILCNALIIPWVLKAAYGISEGYLYLFVTVGIGEILSCGVLGMVLYFALKPVQKFLFPGSE